jgi:hypothetical protein
MKTEVTEKELKANADNANNKATLADKIKRVPETVKDYIKKPQVWGFFVSLVVIALLAIAFFHPDASLGNQLRQHDMQQGAAIGQEVKAYMQENPDADEPRWTNSLFSGMPTFQISPSYPSNSLFNWINTLFGAGLPSPSNLLFMMMAGMLIMLLAMKVRWYYALIGAIAWGFSSYFVIIIGAGHIWKFVTLAYIPPTIGGIIMAYRGRWFVGSALAALFAMMQIESNHVQMTYYFLFVILSVIICYIIDAIRRKEYSHFLKATGALAVAAVLAVAANLPSLYNTYKYSKESMRGSHTELTNPNAETESTGGLDRSYITQYSYGCSESFSLLIPNIKGGASAKPVQGSIKPTSLLDVDGAADKVTNLNEGELQYLSQYVSQYFGEPEGTNGPVYVGAIICVLFLLGCFIVRGPLKWALLAMTLMSIMLALGRNLQWFTDLFIDYVPMYSSFRTVESILVIAEFTMPVLAIMALQKLLTTPNAYKKYFRPLCFSFGIVAVICLAGYIAPSLFGSAITENDQYISNMIASQLEYYGYPREAIAQYSINNPAIAQAVSDIRYGMVSADSMRSLLLVLATFAILMLCIKGKIKKSYGVAIIGLLTVLDLYMVDKRYLNHDSFCPPDLSAADPFPLNDNDRQILADTAMNYRVMDIPRFGSAEPSYHHKMIGGYHAAKLTRYQDLIDRHLSHFTSGEDVTQADFNVLDMLNAKYIIAGDNSLMVNPNALGNAWFVNEVKFVDNPDEEMAMLSVIEPDSVAVADKKFQKILASKATTVAPGDTIFETSYTPSSLTYSATSQKGGVAVFSEVYFPWGWEATIDGKPAEIARVNYVLRAIAVPAGHHKIEMRFNPQSVSTTVGIARTAVILIYLLLAGALVAVLLKDK